MKKILKCQICESKNKTTVWKNKKFPLTGIFHKKKNVKIKSYDLYLDLCSRCQHLQLSKIVSNKILYNNKYANRTSVSHLSLQAYNFLKKFIFQTINKKKLGNVLEVGCNDIAMLKKFSKFSKNCIGIDPIWNNKIKRIGNIKIIGKYIENVDFSKDIGFFPDIVITTHNLEHIESPYTMINTIGKNMKEGSHMFIEVPDAGSMIKNLRFDQVFHQHYHYFTLQSLKILSYRANFKLVNHKINKDFWGGSLLVCLKKLKNSNKKKKLMIKKKVNYRSKINNQILKFKNNYKKFSNELKNYNNIICYGAGQMTPSVAYHLKTSFKNALAIVDDNKNRKGLFYSKITPRISYSKNHVFQKKTPYFITALDGTKGIKKKLKQKKIANIISIIN